MSLAWPAFSSKNLFPLTGDHVRLSERDSTLSGIYSRTGVNTVLH
jgi:hypothetical protein